MADAYASIVSGSAASIFGASSLVAASSTALVATDSVTFFLATDGVGVRGGPSPTYSESATVGATVSIAGTPARLPVSDRGHGTELKPESHATLKMVLSADPAATLSRPLKTNDLAVWNGRTYLVIGTALPVGGKFTLYCESIS